jgi:hypothetical protein
MKNKIENKDEAIGVDVPLILVPLSEACEAIMKNALMAINFLQENAMCDAWNEKSK